MHRSKGESFEAFLHRLMRSLEQQIQIVCPLLSFLLFICCISDVRACPDPRPKRARKPKALHETTAATNKLQLEIKWYLAADAPNMEITIMGSSNAGCYRIGAKCMFVDRHSSRAGQVSLFLATELHTLPLTLCLFLSAQLRQVAFASLMMSG